MSLALCVKNLGVRYGDHIALQGLSLQVKPGELIGIVGPNGAGKTSFIKCLCGHVEHEGDIVIADKKLKRGHKRRELLGLVPQEIGLYTHMSGRENLQAFAKIMGVPAQSRKAAIEDALLAVDMQDKADSPIHALSGGMKRRINVAAAIMHNPKVIIFDEPTAGVDVPARDTVHRLTRSLAQRGMGILLVTHELEQAEALCDKLLVLCKGQMLGFDTPSALLSRAFYGMREVMVRYAAPPSASTLAAMSAFEFAQAEHPTVWTAMTQASEVSFVSAFMTALGNDTQPVLEISVRRPGLASLMHRIEKTGQL